MNDSPAQAPTLRPLGLGELLDRAVNLSVKYLVIFALIYAVVEIPMAIVQFVGFGASNNALFAAFLPAATGKPADPALVQQLARQMLPKLAIIAGIMWLLYPVSKAALIEATTSAYLRGAVDFKAAYALALRRWVPLLVLVLLFGLCAVAFYLAVVVVGILLALVLGTIVSGLHTLGVAIDIVLGAVLGIGAFLFVLAAGLAFEVSMFTCVLERASPTRALAVGFQRVFRGVGLKRSLLVGLAYLAVILAILLISVAGAAVLAASLHSALANAVFSAIVGLVTAAFVTAFMGIFYFDLRVREEGLDLELAAQQLASGAAARG